MCDIKLSICFDYNYVNTKYYSTLLTHNFILVFFQNEGSKHDIKCQIYIESYNDYIIIQNL